MKKILILTGIIGLLLVFQSRSFGQCEAEKHCESCVSKLADGFTYLKSYQVNGEGGGKSKVEYSYVFTKGAQYFLNICSGVDNTDGIILTLYDSNRKVVGTNYMNGKFFSAITYPCNATGIYYITFTFENSANHCGGSVLGFKR